MIRKILPKHRASLETLYAESVYLKLPKIVKWALGAARERVFVVEEQNEVRAAMYTMFVARAKTFVTIDVLFNIAKKSLKRIL